MNSPKQARNPGAGLECVKPGLRDEPFTFVGLDTRGACHNFYRKGIDMEGNLIDNRPLTLSGGRILGYAEYGIPTGTPMIGLHGTPGSRLVMKAVDLMHVNKIVFMLGRLSPKLTGWIFPPLVRSSLPSMEQHVQNGTSPSPDISPGTLAIMTADQREAIRTGRQGVVFDMRILWRSWGFRFEDLHTPVFVWHGAADNLALRCWRIISPIIFLSAKPYFILVKIIQVH